VIIVENKGQGNRNNNKNARDMNNPNQFNSIKGWWQQNSPMA